MFFRLSGRKAKFLQNLGRTFYRMPGQYHRPMEGTAQAQATGSARTFRKFHAVAMLRILDESPMDSGSQNFKRLMVTTLFCFRLYLTRILFFSMLF
jgi:hypothetical protein